MKKIFTEEELSEILSGDLEGYNLIEEDDWVSDGKYETKDFIFEENETGKLFEAWIVRSGSYWNDYDTVDYGFEEVVKITKIVKKDCYVRPCDARELKKNNVTVSVVGCDDTTEFDVDLTDIELETLGKIAKLTEENSQYGCQPIIEYEISF